MIFGGLRKSACPPLCLNRAKVALKFREITEEKDTDKESLNRAKVALKQKESAYNISYADSKFKSC